MGLDERIDSDVIKLKLIACYVILVALKLLFLVALQLLIED